jgi:large subunit ribosomal protein L28
MSGGQICLAEADFFGYCSPLLETKGIIIMSRRCEICGKGHARGNTILRRGQAKKKGGIGQHVTAVTPRLFKPNLQVVHAIVNGVHRKIKVCANCIKSGRVAKAA